MSKKEKVEKYEGHGNNWSAVLGDKDKKLSETIVRVVNDKNSDIINAGDYFAIISFDPPIRGLALNYTDKTKKSHILYSIYPFLQISNPIPVEINKIDEWDNGVEAIIWGSIGEVSLSFFDSLYFLNKSKYKIGEEYRFHLGAIAHSFEKRTKDLMIDIKEGPFKGKKFYTQKATSYMPSNEYGGEFSFTCPFVSFSGNANFLDQSFSLFPFYLRHGEDESNVFTAPMFVNNDLIKSSLKTSDSIHGVAWMQGYLEDSFFEE